MKPLQGVEALDESLMPIKEIKVHELLLHLADEEGSHYLLEEGRVFPFKEEIELMGEVLLEELGLLLIGIE